MTKSDFAVQPVENTAQNNETALHDVCARLLLLSKDNHRLLPVDSRELYFYIEKMNLQ